MRSSPASRPWSSATSPLVSVSPVIRDIFGEDVGIYNALSAGIVVGLMIVPIIASLSEDAMRAVPRSLREGAYALGSTRMEVSLRVVLPAAFSGVVASIILAASRAVGETMAVTHRRRRQPAVRSQPGSKRCRR